MWLYRASIIIMFQWCYYIWQAWGFFLGAWVVLVVGSELGKNGGSELGFWYGRVLGTILSAVYVLPIGTCNGRVLGYLEGFIYGSVVGKCLCLCCCRGYVHM